MAVLTYFSCTAPQPHTKHVIFAPGNKPYKPPSDFQKYVLGKVKATTPGASAVANKRWNIPKEI